MSPAGVAATELLERAGIGIARFVAMVGVKATSVRSCFSNGRLSKKMYEALHDISNDVQVRELVDEAVMGAEGNEDDVPDPGAPREGRIYCLPRNRHLYLVEFPDGERGKFRGKPGFFHVGGAILLKLVSDDLWELVGDYDRRGRLIE